MNRPGENIGKLVTDYFCRNTIQKGEPVKLIASAKRGHLGKRYANNCGGVLLNYFYKHLNLYDSQANQNRQLFPFETSQPTSQNY